MGGRVLESVWAILVTMDVIACTIWLASLYVFNLAGKPTGRQTISGYVGKAAYNKNAWALRTQNVINHCASVCGDSPNHCYRMYLLGQG